MVWTAVAVVTLLLLVAAAKRRARRSAPVYPYQKQPALFSAAERSFLGVLELAVGQQFRLFGKVRVADVLGTRSGLRRSARPGAFNRISGKHFDFVLCSPGDLSVVCAIELDDQPHRQHARRDRDEFLAGACLAADLPLITFQAGRVYRVAEVSARIANTLSAAAIRRAKPVVPVVPSAAPGRRAIPSAAPHDAPRCRRCASPMIKRTAKGGENAGREFWGCSSFPACREIVAL